MSRPIKLSMNSPHTMRWLAPIGKLVVNFAAIELHTYWWLGALSKNEQLPLKAVDWPFKRRVDLICELLTACVIEPPLKQECINAWQHSLEIAKIRNALVHNPIVFGWLAVPETGEPDIVGIADIAHLGRKPRVSKRIASLTEVNANINDTAGLAAKLFELLSACDADFERMATNDGAAA